MTMMNFADDLFTDLMREHTATLQRTELPPPSTKHSNAKRGAWLAGGAIILAAGVTSGLAAFGGGVAPAFAVTAHADGLVTITLSDPSAIPGANAKLQALGVRVALVPVKAGCPAAATLPAPAVQRRPGHDFGVGSKWTRDSVTVIAGGAHEVPPGDLELIAVQRPTSTTVMGPILLTSGRIPACISLPSVPGAGS